MADRIKTFLLVALVTVLVWVFAESESLRTEKVKVGMQFGSSAGRIVRVEPEQVFDDFVDVTMEGSTGRIDELIRDLQRSGVRIEPGAEGFPIAPGPHVLDIRTVLRAVPEIRDSGVTITAVDPASVLVTVDELRERIVKVRPVVPDGQIDGAPEAIPAQVTLRIPASLAHELPADFELTARVDPAAISALPEDRFATVPGVRVDPPQTKWGSEFIRIEPPQVDVKLTPRPRSETFLIPTVPVQIRLSAAAAAAWDVEIPAEDRLLSGVRVTGPRDVIDQIRTEKIRVIAYVPLSFEDLERAAAAGEPIEREAQFADIPSALALRFDAPRRTVRLTIRPRPTPGAPPPPG